MKNLSLVVLGFSILSGAAFAADNMGMRKGGYGQAGCGLGSMVFESNSTFNQVLAATTNGTFGSQTFGITSGTSNCTSNGVAQVGKEQEMFAEANFQTLSREMAQGKGETLDAFANVLGCESTSKVAFGKVCKDKFSSKFAKASNSNELLGLVKQEVKANPTLAQSCKL